MAENQAKVGPELSLEALDLTPSRIEKAWSASASDRLLFICSMVYSEKPEIAAQRLAKSPEPFFAKQGARAEKAAFRWMGLETSVEALGAAKEFAGKLKRGDGAAKAFFEAAEAVALASLPEARKEALEALKAGGLREEDFLQAQEACKAAGKKKADAACFAAFMKASEPQEEGDAGGDFERFRRRVPRFHEEEALADPKVFAEMGLAAMGYAADPRDVGMILAELAEEELLAEEEQMAAHRRMQVLGAGGAVEEEGDEEFPWDPFARGHGDFGMGRGGRGRGLNPMLIAESVFEAHKAGRLQEVLLKIDAEGFEAWAGEAWKGGAEFAEFGRSRGGMMRGEMGSPSPTKVDEERDRLVELMGAACAVATASAPIEAPEGMEETLRSEGIAVLAKFAGISQEQARALAASEADSEAWMDLAFGRIENFRSVPQGDVHRNGRADTAREAGHAATHQFRSMLEAGGEFGERFRRPKGDVYFKALKEAEAAAGLAGVFDARFSGSVTAARAGVWSSDMLASLGRVWTAPGGARLVRSVHSGAKLFAPECQIPKINEHNGTLSLARAAVQMTGMWIPGKPNPLDPAAARTELYNFLESPVSRRVLEEALGFAEELRAPPETRVEAMMEKIGSEWVGKMSRRRTGKGDASSYDESKLEAEVAEMMQGRLKELANAALEGKAPPKEPKQPPKRLSALRKGFEAVAAKAEKSELERSKQDGEIEGKLKSKEAKKKLMAEVREAYEKKKAQSWERAGALVGTDPAWGFATKVGTGLGLAGPEAADGAVAFVGRARKALVSELGFTPASWKRICADEKLASAVAAAFVPLIATDARRPAAKERSGWRPNRSFDPNRLSSFVAIEAEAERKPFVEALAKRAFRELEEMKALALARICNQACATQSEAAGAALIEMLCSRRPDEPKVPAPGGLATLAALCAGFAPLAPLHGLRGAVGAGNQLRPGCSGEPAAAELSSEALSAVYADAAATEENADKVARSLLKFVGGLQEKVEKKEIGQDAALYQLEELGSSLNDLLKATPPGMLGRILVEKDPAAAMRREHARWVAEKNLRADADNPQAQVRWKLEMAPKAHEIGGFAFEEFGMGKELLAEGRAMKHCVGSYIGKCSEGRARIFSGKSACGERITVELAPKGEWAFHPEDLGSRSKIEGFEVVQNRGPHNGAPSQEGKAAATALAAAYSAQFAANTEALRIAAEEAKRLMEAAKADPAQVQEQDPRPRAAAPKM